ncbi:hypothetical protein Hanom_Chr02g00160791 [Helianthus anomalus]
MSIASLTFQNLLKICKNRADSHFLEITFCIPKFLKFRAQNLEFTQNPEITEANSQNPERIEANSQNPQRILMEYSPVKNRTQVHHQHLQLHLLHPHTHTHSCIQTHNKDFTRKRFIQCFSLSRLCFGSLQKVQPLYTHTHIYIYIH